MRKAWLAAWLVATAAFGSETSLKPAGAPLKITKARPVSSTAKDEVTGSLFSSKLGALGFELGLLWEQVDEG